MQSRRYPVVGDEKMRVRRGPERLEGSLCIRPCGGIAHACASGFTAGTRCDNALANGAQHTVSVGTRGTPQRVTRGPGCNPCGAGLAPCCGVLASCCKSQAYKTVPVSCLRESISHDTRRCLVTRAAHCGGSCSDGSPQKDRTALCVRGLGSRYLVAHQSPYCPHGPKSSARWRVRRVHLAGRENVGGQVQPSVL